MRPPAATDQGAGSGRGAVPVSLGGRYPSLIAWMIVAGLLVLTGSRWPSFAYGTIALALLYLLVTNTDRVDDLAAAITTNLGTPFQR